LDLLLALAIISYPADLDHLVFLATRHPVELVSLETISHRAHLDLVGLDLAVPPVFWTIISSKAAQHLLAHPDIQDLMYHLIPKERAWHHLVPDLAELLVVLVITSRRADLDHPFILATLDPAAFLVSLEVISHQVEPDLLAILYLAELLVVLAITSQRANLDHLV